MVSRIGTQMRDVALAWHLYVLTRSPLAVGALGAARVIPIVLFALGGGVLADRYDRRRVMLVTQVVLVLTSAALALATWSGRASPPLLYGLVAMASAANAFDNPARQALVPTLVPTSALPNALSLSILGHQLASVSGPALGGLLLAVTSPAAIYAIDAVSFGAVLLSVASLSPRPPVREPGDAGAPAQSGLAALGEALAFLRRTPVLVALMAVDFFATFFAGSLLLLPFYAEEVFHVGARGLGVLSAAPALGAVAASVVLSSRRPVKRLGRAVLLSVACYGACVAGFGVCPSFVVGVALLAGSGAVDTVSTVARQVARQTLTPDALRGRMTGVNMIFFAGGPQLGEVEAGAVAEWTGPRVSVASGGLACVALAVVAALTLPSLRTLELSAEHRRDD